MLCPECKKSKTEIIETRNEQRFVRRRRQCLRCNYRFTTYERILSPKVKVTKRDGSIEEFKRDKLARGIYLALEKRPFKEKQIEEIIDNIEHEITKQRSKFLPSKSIGKIVLDQLKNFDEVAFLRFLSVYQSFGSASKFRKEAEKLTNK